jgi:ABC-type transport system substrate-binding protein
MIDLKSIARLWSAIPVLLVLVAAVACAGGQSAPGVAPAVAQPAATSAPAAASTQAPALSPTAPAFRAAADSTPAPAATVAAASQPEGQLKVDTVVIAVDPAAGETNLPWAGTGDHHQQMDLVMEVLVDIDPERNIWVPQLATSWELSEDGKQWSFQLVEGVEFHDGWGEFTAQDVLHSATMLTREDTLLAYATDWRSIDLPASQIVSDHELVVQLKSPNPDFLFYIAPSGGGLMMSKAYWDAEGLEGYTDDMIGTGPYRYVDREFGVNVEFEKLPEHWRLNGEGGNPAPVDWPNVDLRWISEPATRNAGLLASEIHLTELTRELADTAVTDHGMKVIQSNFPGNQLWGIFMGLYPETPGSGESSTWEQPWMYPDYAPTNIKVREALNRAVDKDLLIDTLFSGRVTLSPVGGFYPNLPGWDETWFDRFEELYGYDPDRARALLAEAGYGDDNPAELKMIVMNIFGFPESADLVQAMGVMFSDVGIDVSYEEWEFGTYYASWTKKEPKSLGFFVGSPSYKTVYAQLSLFNRSSGFIHLYETEELDRLFAELGQTVPVDERAKVQHQMGELIFTEYGYLPLFYIYIEFVANPEIIDTWEFPGSDGANYGHFDLIRACRSATPCK